MPDIQPIAPLTAQTMPDPPTSRLQKMITWTLWTTMGLVVVGVIVSRFIPRHAEMRVLYHTPTFLLADQDAKPFGASNLRGKAYICDFIFTTCGSACPLMSHKLADVQQQTPANLQLVSFTVNPEHDTPVVLKEYAATLNADPSRWHFLTGTPEQMTTTIRDMKIGFQAASDHSPILHSEKFVLVDGDSNVRAVYDSNDPQSMKDLIKDATWLASTKGARGW